MSETIILGVPTSGPVFKVAGFENSRLSAMQIWTGLIRTKITRTGSTDCERDAAMEKILREGLKDVWALDHSPELAPYERAALICTFDWRIVETKRLADAAHYLRLFHAHDGAARSHLPAIADTIEQMAGEANLAGAAFMWHSPTVQAWTVPDGSGGRRWFDLERNTGENHVDVFWAMEEFDAREAEIAALKSQGSPGSG